MTVTIGAFTCNKLLAQPFGYEGEARKGLTARTFRISGLLTASEWSALVTEYNTWRDLRVQDEDTLKSGVVGTTINVSLDSINSLSISSLPCWFADAPSGTQTGAYVNASVTMVDAAQALEALLRQKEKDQEQADGPTPDLGTITLGSVVITLSSPPDTRQDTPQVSMTASGASLITGPYIAHKLRNVEGEITTGTYDDLLSWYDTTISTPPATGAWFPASAPTANAVASIKDGVKETKYNVSLSLIQII